MIVIYGKTVINYIFCFSIILIKAFLLNSGIAFVYTLISKFDKCTNITSLLLKIEFGFKNTVDGIRYKTFASLSIKKLNQLINCLLILLNLV